MNCKVNIPPARPQPVPTGKPKVPAPVPIGRQNRPFLVPTDRGYSPSVTSGWKNPYSDAEDEGIFDSGCSRSMTGNMERTDYFQEFPRSKSDFWRNCNNSTCSPSICDKKNRVLFTDTDCLVLSKEFMLPDESMAALRVPRKHNLYTINLNNLSPRGNLACLVAKSSIDEFVKWHRRIGDVNYKNMNRLVKDNLVRGLPPKLFKNDHTCVACCKGKQHKASYKAITAVSFISELLQLLHMDLFGPTSIRSINHKYYCLVITDDYIRFCWVFFLEHKDETYPILKDFINLVENQLKKKVKAIRCDNGTEFKNPVFHQRTKHIEIRHHFIRDVNEKKLIQVLKIHTDDNVADLLTRAFDGPRLMVQEGGLFPFFLPPVVSSPKSSGTRRKSLGRNRLTKPKSILKELDLDADDKTFIKVVSDEDSTDEAPILWSALAGWEVISTPLGEINALYRSDQSTKHFTTLREILHMVDRQDLLKLYGMVVTYYENHLVAGAGLMLWGDLQVLIDSQEGGKGSFVWNHQPLWQIRSWRLYTLSNVHVLETISGEVLYMFGRLNLSSLRELHERMLKHKLEIDKDVVGNDMTTAEQLIRFIKNQIAAAQVSPCDHVLLVFNSPMLHLLRVKMVINSPWIMPLLGTKGLASPEQTATGVLMKNKDVASSRDIQLICAEFSSIQVKTQADWMLLQSSYFNPQVSTSRYVVPTGRVVVPTSRYVVPAGKVIIIVSPDRLSLVPTGRVLSSGRVK
ncbi:putative ribonuclease H-like domain-containing protein [Tanacetum coccineum]|uniref:Ribonuclease H-like domain-containing protein n=1 Tax=Tanacetum coccineum TaxID=301880 RepID=A0ABQ4X0U9_9ASTR